MPGKLVTMRKIQKQTGPAGLLHRPRQRTLFHVERVPRESADAYLRNGWKFCPKKVWRRQRHETGRDTA